MAALAKRSWSRKVIVSVLLIVGVLASYLAVSRLCPDEAAPVPRPEAWAQPVAVEGVPNLYRVSDDLYRSGQPSAEGLANLERMGVKTVVNLRSFTSDRDEMEGTGLESVEMHVKAWHAEEEEAIEFLRIVTDPERVPVLVHCNLGSDRTGTMCALYRIVVQSWSKEEAIDEMTRGGFGYNRVWFNLPVWIQHLDIDEMKMQAGLGLP